MRVLFSFVAMLLLCFISQKGFAQANADASSNTTVTHNVAGKIDLLEGEVHVFDNKIVQRTVHVGDKVFEGDSIITGKDGEIHLTMEDTGFIAVRPNTQMRIAQYRANGDDQDKGVFGLLVGSFRSITGWIGKYQPKSYVVRTPTATIGIRGTDHEPKVIAEGSTEGEAGTYDKVNTGGSFISTPQGNVDVTPNHAAFAPRSGGANARPRLLSGVPNFYRPTRNEHLIEGKHAQIQRAIQQRREERRQNVINNRRAQTTRPSNNARPRIAQAHEERQTLRSRNSASGPKSNSAGKTEEHPVEKRVNNANSERKQTAPQNPRSVNKNANKKENENKRKER